MREMNTNLKREEFMGREKQPHDPSHVINLSILSLRARSQTGVAIRFLDTF